MELLRVREGQREGGAITGPTGGRRGEEREVPAHTMDARLTGSKHSSLTKIKASEFFFVLFFLSTGLFFFNCNKIYYPQQEAAKMDTELSSTWSKA